MDKDALYAAAIAGDAHAIAILAMEADRVHEYGRTILHVESLNGNTERVRFILREFAHKNLLAKLNIGKMTALHYAAWYGRTEVASILIDAATHLPVTSFQAFLRQPDEDMDTALHAAVMYGHPSIVKLLVEADPSDRHIQNDEGKTPMYIAVEKGYNHIVEIISTTCTAPSLDGPDGSTAVRIKNLDQAKSPGGTLYKIMNRNALYAAAIAGDADAISKLETRADTLDKYGETILHVESTKGNTEGVRFILREFAHKNLLAKRTTLGKTALHLALDHRHTEVASILIDAARHLPVTSFQAFLRQPDVSMNTALHIAVMQNHASIVKLLVEADPSDTHIQNREGKTPMYIAVEKGYNYIAEIISTTCTAPSWDGPHGSTALRINNLDQADDFEYALSYEDVGHAMITASQPSGFQAMKSLPQPVNMKTMVLENEGDTSAQLPCISQPCEDATEQDEQVLDMRKSTPSINSHEGIATGETSMDELQKAPPTISKVSLSQHFGKSLDEAREIFGDLSRTKFKKMCRGVGIKRWEYGKRKMGSNSSSKHKRRINNEEPGGIYSTDMPCVHDPPVISHTSQVLSTMDIKAMHNGLIIRFELPELSGKSELEDNVIKRLHLDRNSFSIKYEDDGGNWVLITCDEDVRYCMKMSRSWKKTPINIIRLELVG